MALRLKQQTRNAAPYSMFFFAFVLKFPIKLFPLCFFVYSIFISGI